MLLGESFRKFEHLLHEGEFVYIGGVVQERYQQQDNRELRISSIELLQEVMDKYTEGLELRIDLDKLEADSLQNMGKLLRAHSGKAMLYCKLVTADGEVAVPTFSRKHRVAISADLLQSLATYSGVTYGLRTKIRPQAKEGFGKNSV